MQKAEVNLARLRIPRHPYTPLACEWLPN
jgi:hypothetical protein